MSTPSQSSKPGDPLISVCIPSFNYAELLPQAIESVIAQTFDDFELLVFDDGSTDGSVEIASGFAARDARIHVLTHPGNANRRMGATMNAAFARARGVYLANFGADDLLVPESLERRLAALESNTGSGFAYGRVEIVDAAGRPDGRTGGLAPETASGFDATSDPLQALLLRNYIPGHTILMRRDLFGRAGGFDERFHYCDWELEIRLLAHTRPTFVDGRPVTRVRWHQHNLDADDAKLDLPRRLEVFRALDEKAESAGGRLREPRIRALVRLQRAGHAIQLGQGQEAAEAITSAFHVDPTLQDDPAYLLWWFGRVRNGAVPVVNSSDGQRWLEILGRPSATSEAAVAAGARAGHLPCRVLEVARDELPSRTLDRLRWGVIGSELEALNRRVPSVQILWSSIVRGAREPRLLGEPWFLKLVLTAAGCWSFARRVRRWTTGRRGLVAVCTRPRR